MNNELTYKNFRGSVDFDSEDQILFGKVLFIDSLLMYHGTSIDEIKTAFESTVDAYLEHCKKTNKQPNKPYSGTFNVRIGAELHKKIAELSSRKNISINETVCRAVTSYIDSDGSNQVIVNHNHTNQVSIHLKVEDQSLYNISDETQSWEKKPVMQ